tara:strand:+ start:186 stop:650 length:465 start_codon:yes stop_codon:yes gene_type:complete
MSCSKEMKECRCLDDSKTCPSCRVGEIFKLRGHTHGNYPMADPNWKPALGKIMGGRGDGDEFEVEMEIDGELPWSYKVSREDNMLHEYYPKEGFGIPLFDMKLVFKQGYVAAVWDQDEPDEEEPDFKTFLTDVGAWSGVIEADLVNNKFKIGLE